MGALKTGLAVALAAFFTAACSDASESTGQNRNAGTTPDSTAAKTDPASSESSKPSGAASNTQGAYLYKAQMCAGCHGPGGKGMVSNTRDFTDPAWQKQMTDDQMIARIKEGAPPMMPAYKDKLNDAQIKALVAHLRSFSK